MGDILQELADFPPNTIITVEGRRIVRDAKVEIEKLRGALRKVRALNHSDVGECIVCQTIDLALR